MPPETLIFGILLYKDNVLVVKKEGKIQLPNTKKDEKRTINGSIEHYFSKELFIKAKVSEIIDIIPFFGQKGPKIYVFVRLKTKSNFDQKKFEWLKKEKVADIYGRISQKLQNYLK
jgi:hypothetical protein